MAIDLGEVAKDADIDREAYHYHLYAQWQTDRQLRALPRRPATGAGLVSRFSGRSRPQQLRRLQIRAPSLPGPALAVRPIRSSPRPDAASRPSIPSASSTGTLPDRLVPEPPPVRQRLPDRPRDGPAPALLDTHRGRGQRGSLRLDPVRGDLRDPLGPVAHRQSAWLVGEDLGTVPPEVEGAIEIHGVRGMYVVQYENPVDQDRPLREVPESTVGGVNTHDMPPFASFWFGPGPRRPQGLGLLDQETPGERAPGPQKTGAGPWSASSVTEGFLGLDLDTDVIGVVMPGNLGLAGRVAGRGFLLLNVEEFWLETEPQNTPNTYLRSGPTGGGSSAGEHVGPPTRSILRTLEQIERLRAAGTAPDLVNDRLPE